MDYSPWDWEESDRIEWLSTQVDCICLKKESQNLRYNFKNGKYRRNKNKIEYPEQNIQELWNSYKRCTVGKMGILRGRQEQKQYLKQQWLEFPQVTSDTKPHIQEAQGTLNRINTKTKQKQNKKPHIDVIFKLQKIKEKEKHLKEKKKEYLSYREAKIKITFNLSQDTMKAKIKWREIFKIQRLKKKKKNINIESCTLWNCSVKVKEKQSVSQTRNGRNLLPVVFPVRNAKRHSSQRRKMT